MNPKTLQHTIGVDYRRFVGCKWNFENRKTRHSDSAKTANTGFVGFGTMHLALSAKKISSSDGEVLPRHHQRRVRQVRRV